MPSGSQTSVAPTGLQSNWRPPPRCPHSPRARSRLGVAPPQPTPSPGPQAARPRVLLGPPTPGLPCAQWSPSSGPWDQAFLHRGPSGKHHSPFWPHFHHMWGPALGSRPIGNLARVDVTPGGGEPVIRELPGTWDALTAAL